MYFIERLIGWLQRFTAPSSNQQVQAFYNALENGKAFKRTGRHDDALRMFETAERLAENLDDGNLPILVALHRVEVYIRQSEWAKAEETLLGLKRSSALNADKVHLAYVTISQGTLAQDQGHWDQARAHYEQALEIAREAQAAGAEGRAQGHLADTYLHEGNTRFAIYLLEEGLPKLHLSGDIELSTYFVGRLGEARIAMGDRTGGQHLLGRALRLAEHMQDRTYEIRWRNALAIQAMEEARYPQAKRHLMVILSYMDRQSLEDDYVLALCRISKACLRLTEYKAAMDYAEQAVEIIKTQIANPKYASEAYACLGIVHRTEGNQAEAITYLDKALELHTNAAVTAAEYSYVDILRNLAAAQAETGDFEVAQETYDRALAYAHEHSPLSEVAATQRDIGILYMRQSKLEEAIRVWLQALQVYEEQGHHARVARLYCDIANVRKKIGQSKRAMKDYEQALMLLSSIDDPETRGLVLSNAATAYVDQGDIETAEAFFVDAIKTALKLQDRHAEATRRGNYGWFLLSTGRAQRALSTLAYALRQSENLGLELQSAVQTDNIGLAYDELEKYGEAEKYHRKALQLLENLSHPYWLATVRANLGHTLIANRRLDEAEELLQDALRTGRDLRDSEVVVRALNGKARIALEHNLLELAQTLAAESVAEAERAGLRRLFADALMIRSRCFAMAGSLNQAHEDRDQAQKLYDILQLTKSAEWLDTTPNSGQDTRHKTS